MIVILIMVATGLSIAVNIPRIISAIRGRLRHEPHEASGHDHLRREHDRHLTEYRRLADRVIKHIAEDDIRETQNVATFALIRSDLVDIRKITNGQVSRISAQMEMVLKFMERQEQSREGREEKQQRGQS